jgi:hypothetical protein
VSMRLRPLGNRPAPPGTLLGGTEGPADGWVPVDPKLVQRLLTRADAAALGIVMAIAQGISRRDLLRRTGEVGIALGLAATGVLWGSEAEAIHTSEPCNNSTGCPSCGPSPPCGADDCRADGQCELSTQYVRKRGYAQGACDSQGVHNCWLSNCCNACGGEWHCVVRCCDCCTPDNNGYTMCSCASPDRFRCHCPDCYQAC